MSFLQALGFTVVVYFGALLVALALAPVIDERLAVYAVGTALACLVASRDRYRMDWVSWLLAFLGPIGWFVLFWRRANALQRLRPTAPSS